jgi:flavin-dependent dehydrogenase
LASATTDILVLGGGVAGATVARLLAQWGHQVHLITKPAGEARLAVSLPPSCAKLFDAVDIRAAIDRAGFIRSTGNTVWWGGDARVEPFAEGARGWQVDLAVLEPLLLEEASRAGVRIERRTVSGDEVIALTEVRPYILDCTGRAGLIARALNVRRLHDGPRTIGLVGEWRATAAWRIPDDSHTLVASYADGWLWSVPTTPLRRHVSAMIDPQRSDLARGGSARDLYLAEIRKSREFVDLLEHAELVGGPWGWDASTYYAEQYARDRWLLVGDAGSFIDPLSSAGVKKALASAWLAAVAVHTAVTSPAMREQAFRFYTDREREVEQHHSEEARRFLSDAARGHDRPFWADRAADATASGEDAAARAAFERIRSQPAFAASAAPHLRIEARPLVRANLITLEPHVIDDGSPVRYLHGVDVLGMLELAPTVSQVPDLFEAYVRRHGPVPLHDFLLALATAIGRGFLVSEWRP